MSLTKESRDALPDADFAVPGKRALPMHDDAHVRMAWNMVDRTTGLSSEEREEARKRILHRANEMGIDTKDWDKGRVEAMRFEAMALELPDVPDHPNRVPFSGVMTLVDEPSDNPVGGAKGRRVMIPKAVAEKALPSLLGMGVDYTPDLSGHDAQQKIGVITGADIQGSKLHIEGFLYGADFPDVVKRIQENKRLLGFSYEAQAAVRDWKQDPVEVTNCVFTGAAILFKDKAAYTTTSLEASASLEIEMTPEELQTILASAVNAAVKPLQDKLDALEARGEEHRELKAKVKKHADALRAAADCMQADGVGTHHKSGHVAVLHGMADSMEADAALGKVPHIFRDHQWLDAAAAEVSDKTAADLKAAQDELTNVKAELAAAKAAAFSASAAPGRETDAGNGGKGGADDKSAEAIKANDAKLKASGASVRDRLTAITLARMSAAA